LLDTKRISSSATGGSVGASASTGLDTDSTFYPLEKGTTRMTVVNEVELPSPGDDAPPMYEPEITWSFIRSCLREHIIILALDIALLLTYLRTVNTLSSRRSIRFPATPLKVQYAADRLSPSALAHLVFRSTKACSSAKA